MDKKYLRKTNYESSNLIKIKERDISSLCPTHHSIVTPLLTGTSPFGLIILCSSVDYKNQTKTQPIVYNKILQLLLWLNQSVVFDK